MKTQICYISPEAKGCVSLTGKPWQNTTGQPIPVVKQFTSSVPGAVHCETADGACLMIPTGKGMLLPVNP